MALIPRRTLREGGWPAWLAVTCPALGHRLTGGFFHLMKQKNSN